MVLLKTFAQHDTFHMIIEHIVVVEYFSKIWGFRTHIHMIISCSFFPLDFQIVCMSFARLYHLVAAASTLSVKLHLAGQLVLLLLDHVHLDELKWSWVMVKGGRSLIIPGWPPKTAKLGNREKSIILGYMKIFNLR